METWECVKSFLEKQNPISKGSCFLKDNLGKK